MEPDNVISRHRVTPVSVVKNCADTLFALAAMFGGGVWLMATADPKANGRRSAL